MKSRQLDASTGKADWRRVSVNAVEGKKRGGGAERLEAIRTLKECSHALWFSAEQRSRD